MTSSFKSIIRGIGHKKNEIKFSIFNFQFSIPNPFLPPTSYLPPSRVKGFTLVETLVSTMIISLIIIGPLTVASNASLYAKLTKDTLVANYLAQEAIELLRHQQDSLHIRCIQSAGSSCTITGNESSEEAAWRIFKERLGNNGRGQSCYSAENASGCVFDFVDMASSQDVAPTKYTSTSESCDTLSVHRDTKTYVCSGIRGTGADYTETTFSRTVSITSLETFPESGERYNDDLRVTVTVRFKRSNGYQHEIKVVDFLHAKT